MVSFRCPRKKLARNYPTATELAASDGRSIAAVIRIGAISRTGWARYSLPAKKQYWGHRPETIIRDRQRRRKPRLCCNSVTEPVERIHRWTRNADGRFWLDRFSDGCRSASANTRIQQAGAQCVSAIPEFSAFVPEPKINRAGAQTSLSDQFSLKRFCPSRSFRMSSSDNLVTGAAACSLELDAGSLFTGGAARWATTFFTGSRFTRLCFFGTPSPAVGVVGFGPGIVSTILASGHRSAKSGTLGGGTIVGKLVSISTRSGNRSIELILMTGLSIPLRIGSETGCGNTNLVRTAIGPERCHRTRSISARAFDRLHLETTSKPLFLEES